MDDGVLGGVVLSVWGCALTSQEWVGTPVEAVDDAAGLVGGRPARESTVPENGVGPVSAVGSGGRVGGDVGPERGDQDSTGDEDLAGRRQVASGDANLWPAGNRPTAVGGGPGGGSVSVPPVGPRPVTPIRSTQLGDLANEVGHDTGIVERFVVDFLRLLDQRLAAVTEALTEDDTDGAVTVLRSLETTGAMLGATGLVEATGALRRALRDDLGRVHERLRDFKIEAEALRVRLTALSSVLTPPEPRPSHLRDEPGQSGSARR